MKPFLFAAVSLALPLQYALAADAAALATPEPALASDPGVHIAGGPFKPTWDSLAAGYKCPEWFRDAKFGMWAHWTAQCVPEKGDWYARSMYQQGTGDYKYSLNTYGPQSKFGFKDYDNLWKAEHWDPDKLMALYKAPAPITSWPWPITTTTSIATTPNTSHGTPPRSAR